MEQNTYRTHATITNTNYFIYKGKEYPFNLPLSSAFSQKILKNLTIFLEMFKNEFIR